MMPELMNPQVKSTYSFRRGQTIPKLFEDFWQVERGLLQLQTQNTQGQVIVLGWLQEGSFWGEALTKLSNIEAIALCDCSVYRIAPQTIQSSDSLKQLFLNQAVHRLHQTEYLLAITGLRPIEERLIKLLLFLKEELGQPDGENIRIRCRFTHKNLADAIGTTRVTVTRLFKDFQDKSWLFFDEDRHLIITNIFPTEQSIIKSINHHVAGDKHLSNRLHR